MKKSKSYLLTGIDADLWKDFKAACAHYNISIKDVFFMLIANIVSDHRAHKNLTNYITSVSNKKGI